MLSKITLNGRITYFLYSLFVVVIISTVSFIVKTWRNDWILAHQPLTHIQLKKNVVLDTKKQLVEDILQSHLFGQVLSSVSDMPISNLELHLTGIVHGKTRSKAYIVIANQPAKIYGTGDTLPFGAKIYAITEDTVILQNDDRLEKLTLSRTPLAFKANHKLELS